MRQLAAFSATKALRRQIILHGCLSRLVATTPLAFTSEARCPLWLRLATSHGAGVSVAAAVMEAVQRELARSQPPHRSERMPEFDTSFNESLDRSFLFTPYPAYGRWYLTLYAECYSEPSAASPCAPNASANIPVMILVRSTPCINQRCRDVGEPSTLPPARRFVSNVSLAKKRLYLPSEMTCVALFLVFLSPDSLLRVPLLPIHATDAVLPSLMCINLDTPGVHFVIFDPL
ncbi:unnamed protein product [Dibothriocephalus latus]|uniref:Uncharacterized protein n=1 Tax=Dibothriocephalus latus TaxID=60516 RepID=A0A3P7LFP6_DIBLA|nr:unnamed protein product [Dibothriocephalus latus]